MARTYSALHHLAWSVWLTHDSARCRFAMMTITVSHTIYFDASGKPKPGDVFSSPGSSRQNASGLRFEKEWQSHMDKWGIRNPFHVTHYARGAFADYARFRNNDAERVLFEKKAGKPIKDYTCKPFSFGLAIDDYDEACSRYELSSGFDRPYSLAALGGHGQ
jgi:hypothetical protein